MTQLSPPLNEVVDFLDQGLALFDAQAKLTIANSSLRKMYPALPDMLEPGTPWEMFLHEAVNRGAMPLGVGHRLGEIESGLEKNSLSHTVELPTADGSGFTIRLMATSDGGFALSQALAIDKNEETSAAREAEQLLRKVLEACPTSLTMSRVADGQIIYRSPAATALLGTAKSSFAHFAKVEERADFVTALLPDARVDDMRVTCLRADGEAFPAQVSARLIDYRGEDVIVANIEDLTQELAVKQKLDRQRIQLFQAEKLSSLGELLASVSHELNNPLSIIVGNAEILQEELEHTKLDRRISSLTQAAHRCIRIVRSFLALARQEPLDLKPVDPEKLIDSACDAVRAEAEAAGIGLKVQLAPACPAVEADDVQLTQVVINLLTNAIHAIRDSQNGNEILVRCSFNDSELMVDVSDNGPGVPEELKTRIFDPLFTTKEIGKGTGVGLAYCYRILLAHKGEITLQSSLGKGACFSVALPLSRAI
ncbi:MAG: ATP-binding protein [Pseudomonadota bacterium]